MDKRTMMRALLGDREAQEAITARGELLPCPHCKGRAVLVEGTLKNEGKYSVVCGGCFCATTWCVSKQDSVERWNHRAPLLTPTQLAVLERETGKIEEGLK